MASQIGEKIAVLASNEPTDIYTSWNVWHIINVQLIVGTYSLKNNCKRKYTKI